MKDILNSALSNFNHKIKFAACVRKTVALDREKPLCDELAASKCRVAARTLKCKSTGQALSLSPFQILPKTAAVGAARKLPFLIPFSLDCM